jgi:hypothetical protein
LAGSGVFGQRLWSWASGLLSREGSHPPRIYFRRLGNNCKGSRCLKQVE